MITIVEHPGRRNLPRKLRSESVPGKRSQRNVPQNSSRNLPRQYTRKTSPKNFPRIGAALRVIPVQTSQPRTVANAYALWLLGLVGIAGVHRMYLGRNLTGVLWLLSWGLCGVGQFLDVFFIPSMVLEYNRRLKEPQLTGEALLRRIVQLALSKKGILTPTLAIAEIEADITLIEQAFRDLERRGYAFSENDPNTGGIVYRFTQLEAQHRLDR